jgi:hypothetical protein
MPATATVTRGDLIEETLDHLYRLAERPAQVVVGATALSSESDTTLTLASGVLNVSDKVEAAEGEVMLVTAKSADATPIYTVSRGYSATTRETVATGGVLLKNPTWERQLVSGWIGKCVDSLMNAKLPYIHQAVYEAHATYPYVELEADALDVFRVRHFSTLSGRVAPVGHWSFEAVPTSIVTSGKLLRVTGLTDGDQLIIDVWRPYSWTGDGEDATVPLPLADQDVPVLWAAAYAIGRREISRSELDKIEEWNQEQAIRAGVNLRMLRDAWGEVYRRVDEAKEVHRVPRRRPYRGIPRSW